MPPRVLLAPNLLRVDEIGSRRAGYSTNFHGS
jgi:hypothetical protein